MTSALTAEVRATLERALALAPPVPSTTRFNQREYPGLRVTFTPKVDDSQAKLLGEVFAAVQWPRLMPMAHTLSPAQREVALALCDAVVDVGDQNVAIPAQRHIRRRWLGLDPPTALEGAASGTLPLWLLLAEGRPLPDDLSVIDRLQIARDVFVDAYGLRRRADDVTRGLGAAVDAFAAAHDDDGANAGANALLGWATAAAHDVNALFAAPERWVERGRVDDVPDGLCRLLLRALVRGGGVIDEALVGLVRFSSRDLDEAAAIAAAIAPDRRGRAIVDAAAPLFANDRVTVLLHLVQDHVSDAVVDAIFDTFNDPELTRPRGPLYATFRDAVSDPAFAPYVARRLDALPKPRALRCRASTTPAEASLLSPLQRAQVAVGAQGIQGCGTDWINDEELPHLELFAIEDDAGVHLYDAAVLMGEDGVFFRAGDVEPVAWLCQYRLDCADAALKDGLSAALAARHQ